jgi:hypothetical protein
VLCVEAAEILKCVLEIIQLICELLQSEVRVVSSCHQAVQCTVMLHLQQVPGLIEAVCPFWQMH